MDNQDNNKTTKTRKALVTKQQRQSPIIVFREIQKWRKSHQAPVDVFGCERQMDKLASLEIQKYQILISLVLSVQTKDQTTSQCMDRLKQYGLTPDKMCQIDESELVRMIYECNYNRRKARNIIAISRIIQQRGLPKFQDDVMELPGVGVKIAMIYMKVAEGVVEGVGVDTHVHRISNRLGWTDTKTPEETEKALRQLLPKDIWHSINISLVGFGQLMCSSKKPNCKQCPVRKVCPSSSISF